MNRSQFAHCNSLSSSLQLKCLLRMLHKDPFLLLSQLLLQLFPIMILKRRQSHVLLWSWWSIFSWSCCFICSRWYTFHFNTTSHSSTRAISLTTPNPLHANPWRARSQTELFLLCRMMVYHYRCFGKPFASLASSKNEQLFKKNCEAKIWKMAIVKPSYLSHRQRYQQTSYWTSIPTPVVVNIERSKMRSNRVRANTSIMYERAHCATTLWKTRATTVCLCLYQIQGVWFETSS